LQHGDFQLPFPSLFWFRQAPELFSHFADFLLGFCQKVDPIVVDPYEKHAVTEQLRYLPVDKLHAPRILLRPVRQKSVEFAELMESIRTDGILQSLLVRPHPSIPDEFEIVEGEHRRKAAKAAGRNLVPCIIREMSDDEALIIQLKANAVRPEETRNYEYARRLKKLMQEGMTLAELSVRIDKAPDWIKRILKLNNLCEEARTPVNNGDIPLHSAIALATLSWDIQKNFIEDAKKLDVNYFVARAREARRDFDAFLLQQSLEEQAKGYLPKLRPIVQIVEELETHKAAKAILKQTKAKTILDGWNAAIAWMLRIDPISIHKRQQKISEGRYSALSDYEKRKLRRQLVETITNQKPGALLNG